jgi:23S rRNA pseudouridine1911/1915/1917 synthase
VEPRIVFEDEWLVVVDKPAGMVTNNAQTAGGLTVQSWFESKILNSKSEVPNKTLELRNSNLEFYEKGGVVHRLDKDTSGLVVLAKTPAAYANLKEQFLTRKTKKTYLALVHGKIEPGAGIISLPIARHPKAWGKFAVGNDPAKTAITEWQRIKIYDLRFMNKTEKLSFLELRPLTGRTHQLRVHLHHLGHPVVADPMYLGSRLLASDVAWCPRLFLHAAGLEFRHPAGGEKREFKSELPADLAQVMEKLVHWTGDD